MDISVRVIIIPAAPTNLVATTTSATRIDLSWADGSSNETGFKIESKIGVGGTYSEIDSVGTNVTSYAATALSPSTAYYFRVRAFNNDGASTYTNEVGATTEAAPYTPPASNSGSSGSPAPYTPPPVTNTLSVNISGMAYPVSKVNIILDGAFVASATADAGALFSKTIEAPIGVHHFGVYSTDTRGKRSPAFTFTLSLNSGTVAAVSGIFLAPIIDIDKSEVKKGDTLTITGQTAPSSTVSIVIHSAKEILKDVISDIRGRYSYVLDTGVLELGSHVVKSQAALSDNLVSSDSQSVTFEVGTKTVGKNTPGDATKDGRVNMVDFSIILYNWNKSTKSALGASDFNRDGKVNIVDLSILLYNWTG
jgi:hypothetical protein